MKNKHDRGSLTQINMQSYHDMVDCLEFYAPLENFTYVYMETSPLHVPVNGFKF